MPLILHSEHNNLQISSLKNGVRNYLTEEQRNEPYYWSTGFNFYFHVLENLVNLQEQFKFQKNRFHICTGQIVSVM